MSLNKKEKQNLENLNKYMRELDDRVKTLEALMDFYEMNKLKENN